MSITKVLTRIAHDWAIRCFGLEHVTDLPVRSLRLLEETTELAQALGLSREQAHLCIDRVYDRPPGDSNQEIGGVMVTLNVLCESMGVDSEALFEREVRRVLNKPSDHFAKRNQAKIDMGLDARAQSSDGPITFRDGERVKADRMWRDTEVRKRFEAECGLQGKYGVAEYAADYGDRFTRWALSEIRTVPPPGAQS